MRAGARPSSDESHARPSTPRDTARSPAPTTRHPACCWSRRCASRPGSTRRPGRPRCAARSTAPDRSSPPPPGWWRSGGLYGHCGAGRSRFRSLRPPAKRPRHTASAGYRYVRARRPRVRPFSPAGGPGRLRRGSAAPGSRAAGVLPRPCFAGPASAPTTGTTHPSWSGHQ